MWLVWQYSLLCALPCSAFFGPPSSSNFWTELEARKSSSKKKPATSTTGGFGSPKPKPKVTDDFAVFPKLEAQIAETLDPAPDDWATEADQLPQEVYDRLKQIYGLGNFNYDSAAPISLSELMSSPTNDDLLAQPAASTSISGGGSSTLNLDDLLASATGGAADTKVSSSAPAAAKQVLSLDSLANFKEFRILHIDPLVLAIDDFFTAEECDKYVAMSSKKSKSVMQSKSPTVGKDANAKAQRTSTTYYHYFENVPELMSKASRLLGLDTIDRWEGKI